MTEVEKSLMRSNKILNAMESFESNKWIPHKALHARRNDFNYTPDADAEIVDTLTTRRIGRKDFNVYRDNVTGAKWIKMPWWLSLFHNPARNHKFVAYDSDVIPTAQSSSEFIVRKKCVITFMEHKTYRGKDIQKGSFNFRARGMRHFFADILPVVIYCKCIGV